MSERQGNLYRATSFRNGGRRAGMGMYHDDYSEESGNKDYEKHELVRFPYDNVNPEELNGPVICYKGEKAK